MTSVVDDYSHGQDRPLGGYVATMSVYATLVGLLSLVARKGKRQLPERLRWDDIALASVATFRLARLIAKDTVTSPLRAPFTGYEGTSGPSEVLRIHHDGRSGGRLPAARI